jgi:hypothetical protein
MKELFSGDRIPDRMVLLLTKIFPLGKIDMWKYNWRNFSVRAFQPVA